MNFKKTTLLILLVLLLDQATKIYIKTNFVLNESVTVLSWFKLHFIENEGMAWGTRLSDIFSFLSPKSAKLILTWFRIVVVIGISIWLVESIKNKKSRLLIISIALIFSGALGNILDAVFYGVFFSGSVGQVATFLPNGGGYAAMFYGHVVDMFHFPIYSRVLPEELPLIGGRYISFFDPIFNVADVAISTGIGILVFFNKKAFRTA